MGRPSQAERFASLFREESKSLLEAYWKDPEGTVVSQLLEKADLSAEQSALVQEALELALTEAFYTVLLALDGAAALGGEQQQYSVSDENGRSLYESGELEAAAWLYFHRPMELDGNDT